jgi:hypothetical protein
MSTKRSAVHTRQELAFAMRVQPIGGLDLALVKAAMADSAPEWTVELHGICSDDGEDEMGPSFMISRESYGFRIDQVHWDVVTEIGVFATMRDIVKVLRHRLAFHFSGEVPVSVTLH